MQGIQAICENISTTTGEEFVSCQQSSLGGGSINQAWKLTGQCGREFFIKLNNADRLDMFTAEAVGLTVLAEANVIRVPLPICQGICGWQSYLVLEYIAFQGGGKDGQFLLGKQLAMLHQTTGDQFGWQGDNTIGATPQVNNWNDDWIDFFRHQRLGYQRQLAIKNGCGRRLADGCERLMQQLERYFDNYQPVASLLHGDLWSGNVGFDENKLPVIFDPAPYYGDRESDIAMTELFGGFSESFYQGYEAIMPLDPGYAGRRGLYKLYHIINHFNLFAGSYASQAESLIENLLIYRVK